MDHRRLSRCVSRGRGCARHARHDASHDTGGARHDPTPDVPGIPGVPELLGTPRDDPAARIIARLTGLGSRLGGQPRQEFRTRLRESLLSAHESGRHSAGRHARPSAPHAASHAVPPPPPIRRPLLVRLRPAVLVLALVAVMLLASWGTRRAVPGDMLYPLKRGAESALVGLTMDETSRAERELLTARNRAAEAAELAEDPKAKKLLEATIDDMASSTRSALSTLTRVKPRSTGNKGKVRRFATEQRNMVEPILPSLKGSSKEKANAYLHLIERFEAP